MRSIYLLFRPVLLSLVVILCFGCAIYGPEKSFCSGGWEDFTIRGLAGEEANALRTVAPEFAPIARTVRVAGDMAFEVAVDETGDVYEVKILKGLPFGLGNAAASAIEDWVLGPVAGEGPLEESRFEINMSLDLAGCGSRRDQLIVERLEELDRMHRESLHSERPEL